MKQIVKIVIPLLFIFLFLSCRNSPKQFVIGIIQINDSEALDVGREGIIEALKENGFVDGQNIKIIYKNAQGDMANIPQILQSFKRENVDLVATISTPCMLAAAQQIKDIPVVFSIAFGPEQMGIKNVPPNITGVYDPLEMKPFIDLIKKIVPAVKKVGIPYNPSEANAVFAANKIKEACISQNIEPVMMALTSSSDIIQVCEALAQKNIDAFATSSDNTVFLAIDGLIRVSKKYKIPVFSSEALLVNSGVLANLGMDYKEWGKVSGKAVVEIIQGKKVADLPIKTLTGYKLSLNLKTAQEIGLDISQDLIKEADIVVK